MTQLLVGERYKPWDALSNVRCAFLAIYGGLDLLVLPWKGAKEPGQALQQAETADSTVVIFPDGDHRIQHPKTGQFVAGYLDLFGDWAAHRVHRRPVLRGTKRHDDAG